MLRQALLGLMPLKIRYDLLQQRKEDYLKNAKFDIDDLVKSNTGGVYKVEDFGVKFEAREFVYWLSDEESPQTMIRTEEEIAHWEIVK